MRHALALGVLASFSLAGCMQDQDTPSTSQAPAATAMVALGEALFNDSSLSSNGTQACASCHDRKRAFTDPRNDPALPGAIPVSPGAEAGHFGVRNAPTLTYAALTPALSGTLEDGELQWIGGLFLDGRVDSLEEQAEKPFTNPDEMANADEAAVIAKLRTGSNATAFKQVFGAGALDAGKEAEAFKQITQAIAAFERTPQFAPFSSKFDHYLNGKASLSKLEAEGMALFVRADKGNCAACHPMNRGPKGEPPVFTDFTYDNLGVPQLQDARFQVAGGDRGLPGNGKVGSNPALEGKFRVSTLRNVALTAPYFHNGAFNTLKEVVEFYNTRDTDPARWGPAEVPDSVNHDELGDLKLNDHEVDAIVAFLNTLTDGYQP